LPGDAEPVLHLAEPRADQLRRVWNGCVGEWFSRRARTSPSTASPAADALTHSGNRDKLADVLGAMELAPRL
jgi:hypothetical protein